MALFQAIMALAPLALQSTPSSEPPSTTLPVPVDVTMHLLQLSVPADRYSVEEFRDLAKPILTCDQARSVARKHQIRIVQNPSIAMSRLPGAVQRLLEDLPIGKASQVFGKPEDSYKTLIVCRREAPSPENQTDPLGG